MNLVKFSPVKQSIRRKAFDPFFDQMMNDFMNLGTQRVSNTPAVNIVESGNGFSLEMAAPGFEKEDFSIHVENQNLTVSVDKEEMKQEEQNCIRSEYYFGNFERKFFLGKKIDSEKIEAKYENGILRISLAKKEEAKAKPVRNIEIA